METFVQQIINGLVLGSVYALVALGYTMVYGIINLINFAHGEVLMVGDSVFTDVLGANRAGLWTCLVEPLSRVDFLGSKFWRMLELLFGARQPHSADGEFRRTE